MLFSAIDKRLLEARIRAFAMAAWPNRSFTLKRELTEGEKMSPKKIRLDFGQGGDTPVLSLVERRFYLYGRSEDRSYLHAKYGGDQYYTSQSGASGAGYLQPDAGMDDLIPFGYFRTDIKGYEQFKVVVGTYANGELDEGPIFGYIPLDYRAGQISNDPIVLTDGECVAFLYTTLEVIMALTDWNTIRNQATDHAFSVFDANGDEHPLVFKLNNPDRGKGVNALRFYDLSAWRPTDEQRVTFPKDSSKASFLMGFTMVSPYGRKDSPVWLHENRLGYFDARFTYDPLTHEGEIVDGWAGDAEGLVWRREGFNIHAILETAEFSNGKRLFVENLIPVVKWFLLNKDERRELLANQMILQINMGDVAAMKKSHVASLYRFLTGVSLLSGDAVYSKAEMVEKVAELTLAHFTFKVFGSRDFTAIIAAVSLDAAKDSLRKSGKVVLQGRDNNLDWCVGGVEAFWDGINRIQLGEVLRSNEFSASLTVTCDREIVSDKHPTQVEEPENEEVSLLGESTLRKLARLTQENDDFTATESE